jgi:hypothetical protein
MSSDGRGWNGYRPGHASIRRFLPGALDQAVLRCRSHLHKRASYAFGHLSILALLRRKKQAAEFFGCRCGRRGEAQ